MLDSWLDIWNGRRSDPQLAVPEEWTVRGSGWNRARVATAGFGLAGICLGAVHAGMHPIVAFLAGLAGLGLLALRVTGDGQDGVTSAQVVADQRAQAIAETALVFPVMLMCVLGFFQLTLLVHANSVVRAAAFHAARSATVWIPQSVGGEAPESLIWAEGSTKGDEILRAARFGVVPISQRVGVAGPRMPAFVSSKAQAYAEEAEAAMSQLGGGFPATTYASRYGYAAVATDVEIQGIAASSGQGVSFGRFEDIEVKVLHEYYLGVPWVDRVFAGFDRSAVLGGESCDPSFYTVRIVASCTLPLETAFQTDEGQL